MSRPDYDSDCHSMITNQIIACRHHADDGPCLVKIKLAPCKLVLCAEHHKDLLAEQPRPFWLVGVWAESVNAAGEDCRTGKTFRCADPGEAMQALGMMTEAMQRWAKDNHRCITSIENNTPFTLGISFSWHR